MKWETLSSNEKLAVYAAVAAIVGTVVASWLSGLAWLALLAGVAMLVIVFLPRMSTGVALPGGKGSLMTAAGGIGAVGAVLALVMSLEWFGIFPVQVLFLLLATAGAAVMAWAGWQELQAEGGTFRFGTSSGSSPRSATGGPPPASHPAPPAGVPPPPAQPPSAPPPPAAPPPPVSSGEGQGEPGDTDRNP